MKKRMIMFALLLMAMVGVQAQSLLGTWKTTVPLNVEGAKCNLYLTYSAGQKTTMKIVVNLSLDEFGKLEMATTIPGTYILKGKIVTMKMNSQGVDAKITKMQLNSDIDKMYKENPEIKKMIDDSFNETKVQIKDELKEQFASNNDMEIISLTNTTLKLKEGDDVMTFTRTK